MSSSYEQVFHTERRYFATFEQVFHKTRQKCTIDTLLNGLHYAHSAVKMDA